MFVMLMMWNLLLLRRSWVRWGSYSSYETKGRFDMLESRVIVMYSCLTQGLPVSLLVELAETVNKELDTPLDVILSYSNLTLQNTTLDAAVPAFKAAGVKQILTASPLSMGLLRAEGPHPWHPASQTLKDAVVKASHYVESQGDTLADTAMRFVFARWNGTVVGGWSSVKE